MPHPFLSPEWIDAVKEIRADYPDPDDSAPLELAANVTVTDPPFGDGPIEGHVDTTGPALMIEVGHLSEPEFTLQLPYDLAKTLFVDRDPTQVMPAIFEGKIRVMGDSSKLLQLANVLSPPSDPEQVATLKEIVARVDAVTTEVS